MHAWRDHFINNMLKIFTKLKIKVIDFNIWLWKMIPNACLFLSLSSPCLQNKFQSPLYDSKGLYLASCGEDDPHLLSLVHKGNLQTLLNLHCIPLPWHSMHFAMAPWSSSFFARLWLPKGKSFIFINVVWPEISAMVIQRGIQWAHQNYLQSE